jgi:hypothetical protein
MICSLSAEYYLSLLPLFTNCACEFNAATGGGKDGEVLVSDVIN